MCKTCGDETSYDSFMCHNTKVERGVTVSLALQHLSMFKSVSSRQHGNARRRGLAGQTKYMAFSCQSFTINFSI